MARGAWRTHLAMYGHDAIAHVQPRGDTRTLGLHRGGARMYACACACACACLPHSAHSTDSAHHICICICICTDSTPPTPPTTALYRQVIHSSTEPTRLESRDENPGPKGRRTEGNTRHARALHDPHLRRGGRGAGGVQAACRRRAGSVQAACGVGRTSRLRTALLLWLTYYWLYTYY